MERACVLALSASVAQRLRQIKMSPTRPDILFVMTDQQRFDTIAALGNSHLVRLTLIV